ncbi:MAG: C-factor, partial [Maricaulaceae bacterium]
VDTDLSKPFQKNVPNGKLFTPEYSAEKLLNVIDGATPQDSGSLLAWDGQTIPF